MDDGQLPLDIRPSGATPQRPARARQRKAPGVTEAGSPGADLERRVARVEFGEGALVRLRVPVRIDADSGRDVLTDIDVLALDVDGRLRVSRSILECKSGKGQAGEPDRLLWLSGLEKFLGFDRAVLVRQTVSRRGRAVASRLGLTVFDVSLLDTREAAHAWLPVTFGHVDGAAYLAAQSRSDTQLKGLGHIPADLVAFLRHDALRCRAYEALRAIAALGRAVSAGGVLPSPTREILAGDAFTALLVAAIEDAGRLDQLSLDDLTQRTRRALTTGSPDGNQILSVLARADELVAHQLGRVHEAYQQAGASRLSVEPVSLRGLVASPPEWVPRYVDLVQKFRANPSTARELLQTADLACFEALVGGREYEAKAFDHLFTLEHRYLLNVAWRCLEEIAGRASADALSAVFRLDFDRGPRAGSDRTAPLGTESGSQRETERARLATDEDPPQ